MALNTKQGCCQYFEDTVVPRLRTEFPNLGIAYTQGNNYGQITFESTRRYKWLRKYNGMFVWVNPHLQGNHAEREDMMTLPAVVSGSLMYRDSPKCGEFRWDDLDVMIDEIRKLERNKCCNVCVLM